MVGCSKNRAKHFALLSNNRATFKGLHSLKHVTSLAPGLTNNLNIFAGMGVRVDEGPGLHAYGVSVHSNLNRALRFRVEKVVGA